MLKNNTFLVLVLILFSFNIHSQNITEKGIATVELGKNSCRDGKPSDRNKNLEERTNYHYFLNNSGTKFLFY